MMKVLIVDDEQEIREGLHHMLRTMFACDGDIQVVGSVPDAMAALDFLSACAVDIVLTDIRMPGMDGLGMTETIRYRFPSIQIIVLSGHGDFGYMQKAVRLGTVDYLLKPVNESELEAALQRAALHSNYKLRKNRHMTRSAFEQMSERFKVMLAVDVDDMEDTRVRELGGVQVVSWLLAKVFDEIADELGHLCSISDTPRLEPNNLVIGVFADSQEAGEGVANAFTEQFTTFWRERMKLTVSIGRSASYVCEGAEGELAFQACVSLLTRLYDGTGEYIYDTDKEQTSDKRAKHDLHSLRAALETANEAVFIAEVGQRLDTWVAQKDVEVLVRGLEALFLMLYEHMEERQPASATFRAQQTADLIAKLVWTRNEAALREKVLYYVNHMAEILFPKHLEGHVLVGAKSYIRSHLTGSLTLTDVAEAVYVSPHYLSHLFRERAGMTFLEYVTTLRMEEAKRMLKEPGIKIYEVAEQIGYKSWKHFSRVFKEFTGIGPADYRRDVT
ncbi:response regulator transcription factor [Paenibacillus daejeonensis]|uniref:response regulator transcription factor n=1 Tax=Paenibacillus daejeonensis TaxID=135193 RepID=UPI0003673627|nr:response regulator [Paenibacillus daejeonensis]